MQRRTTEPDQHEIGVGPTEKLSLRVSVAALVRVLFDTPEDGRTMLALERTATLRNVEGRPDVTVTAKPFGGAVRLTNPQALKQMIGDFHYDSERSRLEKDARLLIHPAAWENVKHICRLQLQETEYRVLESGPQRELAEEFEDTLHVRIVPGQYQLSQGKMLVEDVPAATANLRAAGLPTVRIYYVFEARIIDPEVITKMLTNSRRYSDEDLQAMAWDDARQGGRGRANAMLVLGLEDVQDVCRSIPTNRRGAPIDIASYQLDGNVLAILEQAGQP